MLILASQSPRRRALIQQIDPNARVTASGADEALPQDFPARQAAGALAERKARAAFEALAPLPDGAVVIGCDTTVILYDTILGKPKDARAAAETLRRLSGRTHDVVTGVCLLTPGGKCEVFSETTAVTFRPLSEDEIDAYIRTGEPFDKAGAYAIQGFGGSFVAGIDGDYDNVVGLPVAALRRHLAAFI